MNILTGRQNKWELISKISEGDAGVIYLVKAVGSKSQETAILKIPSNNPFNASRQESQIKSEGEILSRLQSLQSSVTPVKLLDTGTDPIFIVEEKASGISLLKIKNVSKNGIEKDDLSNYSVEDQYFLTHLAHNLKSVPSYLLLKILDAVLVFLETIHSLQGGVVWNDVKPDHVFWNPVSSQITIIDWGNAKLLDRNGVSLDGSVDEFADFLQYFDTMGKYIKAVDPDLMRMIAWPDSVNTKNIVIEISSLKKIIKSRLNKLEQQLISLRDDERKIYSSLPTLENLSRLQGVQESILSMGCFLDPVKSNKYHLQVIHGLSEAYDFERFVSVFDSAAFFYKADINWKVISDLSQCISSQKTVYFSNAIKLLTKQNATLLDLEDVFWNVRYALLGESDNVDSINRKVTFNLSVMLGKQIEPLLLNSLTEFKQILDISPKLNGYEDLKRNLDAIINNWEIQEPIDGNWVNFKADYSDIKTFIDSLPTGYRNTYFKEIKEILKHYMIMHDKVIMIQDCWKKQDFLILKRTLRNLLVWDPNRLRVFTAERLVAQASLWFDEVSGNISNLGFANKKLEEGKVFRYFFGKAVWLDNKINELEAVVNPQKIKKQKEKAHKNIKAPLESRIQAKQHDPVIKKTEFDRDKNIFNTYHYDNDIPSLEKFPRLLKEHKWIEAKDTLQDPNRHLSGSDIKKYEKIIETFQAIASYDINWDILVDLLMGDQQNTFTGSIENIYAVIKSLDDKNWVQYHSNQGSLTLPVEITAVIDEIERFSNLDWREKNRQSGKIMQLRERLENSEKTTLPGIILLPYLLNLCNALTNEIKSTDKHLREYQANKNKDTALGLLVSIEKMECVLSKPSKKPAIWKQQYIDIVENYKSIYVDPENPVVEFLKYCQSSPISTWDWGKVSGDMLSFLIVTIVALFLFVATWMVIYKIQETPEKRRHPNPIWPIPFFMPSTVAPPANTAEPTKSQIDDDFSTDAAEDTAKPLPTVTIAPTMLLPTVSVISPRLNCTTFNRFVVETQWDRYLQLLDGINEEQYEDLRIKCGWTHSYFQRKLDVALQLILSQPFDRTTIVREKVMTLLQQENKLQTAVLLESLDEENYALRGREIRETVALCNMSPLTSIPKSFNDGLLEYLNRAHSGTHVQIFEEICGISFENFLISLQVPDEKGINLITYAPPYSDQISPCFYFDGGVGLHYNSNVEDCPVDVSLNRRGVIFVDYQMSIDQNALPPIEEGYVYGIKISQTNAKYIFFVQNEMGQSLAYSLPQTKLSPNLSVPKDSIYRFSTSRVLYGSGKPLKIQTLILGNLLIWRFDVADGLQYISETQILDDEFGVEPISMSLFGYVPTNPAAKLHIIINKFVVNTQGVMP